MWPKWPIILLLLVVATPPGILGESPGDTTPSDEAAFDGSSSPSTTPSPKQEETTDRLVDGDLGKAARVEPMSEGSGQKRGDDEHYDVVDVMAATGTGTGAGANRPKSGQTTRIYTTGEVDESFWLKHLGDDFKHAIHLQVGGTNEEYNRLINQTQNGVHEEVHHEYLPGAERPDGAAPPSPPAPPRTASDGYFRGRQQQQGFDSRSLAMKQQYLLQQQKQHYSHALQHRQLYTPQTQSQHTLHPQQQQHRHHHTQQHRHQQQQHQYPETPQPPHIRYQKPQKHGYIINSSEDQLHASQSNSAPMRSGPEGGEGAVGYEEEGDSFHSQLNFKSPFNDYGSRPTRDLTYLLYRRGL